MVRLFIILFLSFSASCFSQRISGTVVDEENNPVPAVLVFNMTTEKKAYTNIDGEFTIETALNEELRFIRSGFERSSKVIKYVDFLNSFTVTLNRAAADIEEVQIVRLTGDLNQDSKNLTRIDKVYQLQKEIGVPLPAEKPRERPADFKKDVLAPLLALSIKPQAIYDLISGDSRRMKAEYRYDDLQDNIKWIREKVPEGYFTEMGIPPEKISEFLQFSIGVKLELNKYIKAKNLSKVLFILEDTLLVYQERRTETLKK